MTTTSPTTHSIRRLVFATGFFLAYGLWSGIALGADSIDSDADKILRSMSNYLGNLPAFSAKADVDSEVVDLNGQKLQLSSSVAVLIERPGNLYINRLGAFADIELIFDGNTLTLNGKNKKVYLQSETPGKIDNAIRKVETVIGLDAPGADLFYSDPYPGLTSGAISGSYLGTSYVNGVECHYLAFRAAQVDWQIWVQTGDKPLPMKYIITSKWITGAPQYSVRFREWDTAPRFKADQFNFTVPEGARKLDSIQVNEIGEFMMGGAE